MKPIILIKIGGSLITDKKKPNSLKIKNLRLICQGIKRTQNCGRHLIIAHGQGSFAHIPAAKYRTKEGILNKKSYKGIAKVSDTAAILNRIVIKEMLKVGINVVSISPSSIMVAKNFRPKKIFLESIVQLTKNNLIPVLYGDQIMDESRGCTIFSAETVLGFVASGLRNKGYKIEKIIHCSQTDGVYDKMGKTIRIINTKNFSKYKNDLKKSNAVDVTGGMIHKVKETLKLAKKGIPGFIINGSIKGNLLNTINKNHFLGTKISA